MFLFNFINFILQNFVSKIFESLSDAEYCNAMNQYGLTYILLLCMKGFPNYQKIEAEFFLLHSTSWTILLLYAPS